MAARLDVRAQVSAFGLAAAVVAVDFATKELVRARFLEAQTYPVIPGLLNIVHAENRGIAFSFLADATGEWWPILMIALPAAAAAAMAVLLATGIASNPVVRTALALVMGGALGNLYDRATHGTVTDFIEVYYGAHSFPAFNAADSAITIGACLLLLDTWLTGGSGVGTGSKRVS